MVYLKIYIYIPCKELPAKDSVFQRREFQGSPELMIWNNKYLLTYSLLHIIKNLTAGLICPTKEKKQNQIEIHYQSAEKIVRILRTTTDVSNGL
jgi:hypothetical protein